MRRLGLAFAVALVASCSKPDAPPATTSPEARPTETPAGIRSNGDAYVVRLATKPDPIPVGPLFSLEVSVLDGRDGRTPATDVSLDVDARMPEHQHGMNTEPKVTPLGDGRFRVEGMQFHMTGRWELYLDVTRAGLTERAQVEKIVE